MGTLSKSYIKTSIENMIKHNDELFSKQYDYQTQLIQALKDGKLKSKTLIKEAQGYASKRKQSGNTEK